MANVFNEYFSTVFNKKDSYENRAKTEALHKKIEDREQSIVFTAENVLRNIGKFKTNKSPGIDGITSTYALKIKEIIVNPLVHIFNRSFQNNEIPLDWKRANIIPIFKKGSKKLVENYRPVSLTGIFGKTMEREIKNYLEEFLLNNKIIKGSQHGFSRGKSCTSNLLVFQDSILKMLDEGSSVEIIYSDLQKVFERYHIIY